MSRAIFRLIFIASFVISVIVIVAALRVLGPYDKETWAVVAASLAVIASVMASWSAQRVLELEEDARKPYPLPSIDVTSRFRLMQLRVTNYGGSVARDIYLKWHKPLLDYEGKLVRFTEQEGAPEIPVLLPNESVLVLIGGSLQLYETYQDMNYSGEVEFRDASGEKTKHPFYISAEKYRHTLTYGEEALKTHRQLQKIPDELEKLRSEVQQLPYRFQLAESDEEPE